MNLSELINKLEDLDSFNSDAKVRVSAVDLYGTVVNARIEYQSPDETPTIWLDVEEVE